MVEEPVTASSSVALVPGHDGSLSFRIHVDLQLAAQHRHVLTCYRWKILVRFQPSTSKLLNRKLFSLDPFSIQWRNWINFGLLLLRETTFTSWKIPSVVNAIKLFWGQNLELPKFKKCHKSLLRLLFFIQLNPLVAFKEQKDVSYFNVNQDLWNFAPFLLTLTPGIKSCLMIVHKPFL